MQPFRGQKTAIILVLIVIFSALSVSILVQHYTPTKSNVSPTSTPSTTSIPSYSPIPTQTSPMPTLKPTSGASSPPTTTPHALLGEVTQYQNQSLTLVNEYIDYLYAHPDVATAGTQHIDPATYHLALTGMINNPTNYTYNQVLNDFNSTLQVATLPCVEGWSVTLLWQGVPINDLLNKTNPSPDANTIIFLAADGYSTSLPLAYIKQNNIMIAYKMNNITLTPQLGWPFFLVAKNQYGYKWIEWITEINVSNNTNYLGYWERRGYPNDATVQNSVQTQQLSSISSILAVVVISIIAFIVSAVFLGHRIRKHKPESRSGATNADEYTAKKVSDV
jgi:DMSO/TMAO reductase YedYZ molybdopterin-dependent catalytic subunit